MTLFLAYLLSILHRTNTYAMITSIEIAKILIKQKKKAKNKVKSFDQGLLGLGVATILRAKLNKS